MGIEPVNERPIFPAVAKLDVQGLGNWTVSMIRQLTTVFQQYGYRLNNALLREDLDTNGGEVVTVGGDPVLRDSDLDTNGGEVVTDGGDPVLRDSDLAANSGTIPETDRNNTFGGVQSFSNPILLDGAGWNAPTLLNSWVDYNTGGGGTAEYLGARYRKLPSGLVLVQGLVKDGSPPSVVFVLPAGYRPADRLIFGLYSLSGAARVDVRGNGEVIVSVGDTGWTSINCQFFADQ